MPDIRFHILSIEGPVGYSRAGGIARRVSGLSEAIAEAGFETYLWFVDGSGARLAGIPYWTKVQWQPFSRFDNLGSVK